jgi:hypothetical protein
MDSDAINFLLTLIVANCWESPFGRKITASACRISTTQYACFSTLRSESAGFR